MRGNQSDRVHDSSHKRPRRVKSGTHPSQHGSIEETVQDTACFRPKLQQLHVPSLLRLGETLRTILANLYPRPKK